jgi:hypothetical protein
MQSSSLKHAHAHELIELCNEKLYELKLQFESALITTNNLNRIKF